MTVLDEDELWIHGEILVFRQEASSAMVTSGHGKGSTALS